MIEIQNINLTKILISLSFLLIGLSLSPTTAQAVTPAAVNVTVEGHALTMDAPPVIVADRTLIGVRFVGEAVGGTVEWDGVKRQATVRRQQDVVVLTVGETRAVVNGETVTLPVPAQIVNNRTMVPLRFIAEALGGDVEWINETRTANILRRPSAVTKVSYEKGTGKSSLQVSLSEPLLAVTPNVSGNHLTLEFYPARLFAADALPSLPDSLFQSVKLIEDGRSVRMEAELKSEPIYRQTLSADGKSISLEFEHSVTGVQFAQNGRIPEVTILTTGKVEYTDFALKSPGRVVLDLKGTHLGSSMPGELSVNQPYLTAVRSSLFARNPDAVRVVLDLPENLPYEVSATREGLKVRFVPTLLDIKAEKLPGKSRLTLAGSLPMDARVTLSQEKKQIRIDLPQGRSALPANPVQVNDGTITSVSLIPGATPDSLAIVIQLPYYLGHTLVSRDGDKQVVLDMVTSPVYGKRVWIDAGHGRVPGGKDDPGSIGRVLKVVEKQVNLSVALELQQRLEAAGAVVYMTRTGDTGVDFQDRPALVNAVKPPIDLFVSIHHNAAASTSVRGTETYYWTTNPKSRIAAEFIHPAVVKSLGFPDRKVRSTNYLVITKTLAPSVLVELGYLSNADEEKAMTAGTYSAKAAEGIKLGVFDYFWQEIRR